MTPYNDTHEDRMLNMNHRCHKEFPDIVTKREMEEVRVKGEEQNSE